MLTVLFDHLIASSSQPIHPSILCSHLKALCLVMKLLLKHVDKIIEKKEKCLLCKFNSFRHGAWSSTSSVHSRVQQAQELSYDLFKESAL